MPFKPSQPYMDRHTYIPPHVQQAMDRHMQRSMPANLRKYAQDNHGYIPKHAEQAMAQHMEKAVPAQFKKYAGAYVQQKVMPQHMTSMPSAMPQSVPSPIPHGPVPRLLPQDNFHPPGEQHPAQPGATILPGSSVYPNAPAQPQPEPSLQQPLMTTAPFEPSPNPQQQPSSPSPTPIYPPGPALPPPQTVPPQPYDFITNAEQPAPQHLSLPGGSSTAMRAVYLVGGLLVLLILFIIIKGLVFGGPSLALFVGVAQDQQELIHLATNANQQHGIATGNQNFAATAQLTLTSAQASVITYLTTNGQNADIKVLSLKVSTTTDTQLTAAAAAGTYDQTFQGIMKDKLTTYLGDLRQAYQQIKGKKGRTLLSNDYNQAQLLLTQLNSSTQ